MDQKLGSKILEYFVTCEIRIHEIKTSLFVGKAQHVKSSVRQGRASQVFRFQKSASAGTIVGRIFLLRHTASLFAVLVLHA